MTPDAAPVRITDRGPVRIVTIDRPERRNAVDSATAGAAARGVRGVRRRRHRWPWPCSPAPAGYFCAGADLKALAEGDRRPVGDDGPGPMGPTRLRLGKPVIAAIEGPAVAGGLELALWCDLRVAAADATLGVYCRRFGVPLVDLGTVRLPRLIGHSRAIDLILTGRGVDGVEAERIGLVNRVAPPGEALDVAVALADELAALPQVCMRNDRRSALGAVGSRRGRRRRATRPLAAGRRSPAARRIAGAARFAVGAGRHGAAGGHLIPFQRSAAPVERSKRWIWLVSTRNVRGSQTLMSIAEPIATMIGDVASLVGPRPVRRGPHARRADRRVHELVGAEPLAERDARHERALFVPMQRLGPHAERHLAADELTHDRQARHGHIVEGHGLRTDAQRRARRACRRLSPRGRSSTVTR